MATAPSLEDLPIRIARTLRAHRRLHDLSMGELAKRAGVSKTLLSRLEAGTGNPSVETLWRLANALDIPLGLLIDSGEPPATRFIEASEGPVVVSQGGFLGRLILGEGRDHRTEVYELHVGAGVDYPTDAHAAGTEELVVCTHGAVEVGPQGQEVELSPGDALWFPADLPHRYRAQQDSKALLVMSYPSGLTAASRWPGQAAEASGRAGPQRELP